MAKKSARKKSAGKPKAKAKAKVKIKTKAAGKRPAKTIRVRAVKAAAEAAPPGPPKLTSPSVVHWEVQARDPAAQREFFGSLFGLAVDANNP